MPANWCPFDPGSGRVPDQFDVLIYPNDFPAFQLDAEPFSPENAVEAGFLDRVVEAPALHEAARTTALALAALNMEAHAASKLRAREQTLRAIRAGIDADYAAFRAHAA